MKVKVNLTFELPDGQTVNLDAGVVELTLTPEAPPAPPAPPDAVDKKLVPVTRPPRRLDYPGLSPAFIEWAKNPLVTEDMVDAQLQASCPAALEEWVEYVEVEQEVTPPAPPAPPAPKKPTRKRAAKVAKDDAEEVKAEDEVTQEPMATPAPPAPPTPPAPPVPQSQSETSAAMSAALKLVDDMLNDEFSDFDD